jgi:hypothetical protein
MRYFLSRMGGTIFKLDFPYQDVVYWMSLYSGQWGYDNLSNFDFFSTMEISEAKFKALQGLSKLR